MQLPDYLAENGITITAFAKRLGLRVSTLHRYTRGHRFPPAEVLLVIRQETAGAVTADDFVDQHTRHMQAAAASEAA